MYYEVSGYTHVQVIISQNNLEKLLLKLPEIYQNEVMHSM